MPKPTPQAAIISMVTLFVFGGVDCLAQDIPLVDEVRCHEGQYGDGEVLLKRGADPIIAAAPEWAQPNNLAYREGHWKIEQVIRTKFVLDQISKDPANLLASDPTVLHRSAHYAEKRSMKRC